MNEIIKNIEAEQLKAEVPRAPVREFRYLRERYSRDRAEAAERPSR